MLLTLSEENVTISYIRKTIVSVFILIKICYKIIFHIAVIYENPPFWNSRSCYACANAMNWQTLKNVITRFIVSLSSFITYLRERWRKLITLDREVWNTSIAEYLVDVLKCASMLLGCQFSLYSPHSNFPYFLEGWNHQCVKSQRKAGAFSTRISYAYLMMTGVEQTLKFDTTLMGPYPCLGGGIM